MLSPWIIRTATLPSLLASSVPCIALSHIGSWCKLRRCLTPTFYLPQNSHHTYLLWNSHSHSEIYCHATSTISFYYDTLHHCHIASHDHVVGKVSIQIFFIHVTLESLHIPVHRRRHPYRVISCSKYRVVILEL